MTTEHRWYAVDNAASIPSPALLIYSDRIERNVRIAIESTGGPERLRPHVKTHKMPEIVRLHVALGVTKFKCATIAEAEMTAAAGAKHVLLGYQPVGPNIARLVALAERFPETTFATVVDDLGIVNALSDAFAATNHVLEIFLDVDCGMHRTGIAPGSEAIKVYAAAASAPSLKVRGLHAYDGHIHDSDLKERHDRASEAFRIVLSMRDQIQAAGLSASTIVAGGTPTFLFHARNEAVECSPGTYVLWDFGYAETMPDLPFEIAAVLLTRVVSKPGSDRLCLDLGHKAVASESPFPRIKLPDLPDAVQITHSEEHLVVQTPLASQFSAGDVLYAIPRHICPTVALHSDVVVIRNGKGEERWRVQARDRVLTL